MPQACGIAAFLIYTSIMWSVGGAGGLALGYGIPICAILVVNAVDHRG